MLVESSLTVLFEDPFWIGIYERIFDNQYEVCKITFGAEPQENEIHSFLLTNWFKLRFAAGTNDNSSCKRQNPKRIQREINKQLHLKSISTKAQLALQQQREENKTERRIINKEMKLAEQERKFLLRQAKKKAKHRGKKNTPPA